MFFKREAKRKEAGFSWSASLLYQENHTVRTNREEPEVLESTACELHGLMYKNEINFKTYWKRCVGMYVCLYVSSNFENQ